MRGVGRTIRGRVLLALLVTLVPLLALESYLIGSAEVGPHRTTSLALATLATIVSLGVGLYLGARIEETYARDHERLERVLDEMPVAVAIYDGHGRAVIRNRTYRTVIGAEGAPVGIAETLRYFHARTPEGRELGVSDHPTTRALRGETVRAQQVVLDNPVTGAAVHILVNAIPFREGGRIDGALVVFHDVTELHRLDRQRQEFFDMASHEIKTPLTALMGYVQVARRRATAGSFERMDELLAHAETGGKRLADLVHSLLDASRLDEGAIELERERVDLGAFVAAVAQEVSLGLEGRRFDVRRPRAAVAIDADPLRLTQVLQNLLDNAARYSPSGAPVHVSVGIEGGNALVRVTDRGIGIPENERAMLFQRFYRTTRARQYGGTGLGLYISRRIAEMHGGRLWLESTGPTGSVFALSLPLAATAAAPAATRAKDP